VDLGFANGKSWTLVTGTPDASCVARGDLSRARFYVPQNDPTNTAS